ncbi:unnamed protein product [Urochloa humidicola]
MARAPSSGLPRRRGVQRAAPAGEGVPARGAVRDRSWRSPRRPCSRVTTSGSAQATGHNSHAVAVSGAEAAILVEDNPSANHTARGGPPPPLPVVAPDPAQAAGRRRWRTAGASSPSVGRSQAAGGV